MQLVQTKYPPAKIEISKQRFQIRANCLNQSVINGNRHIVWKERRCERRRVVPRPCVKYIRLDGIAEGCGERVLMVAELSVELLESTFAQFRIALHQERAEGALA